MPKELLIIVATHGDEKIGLEVVKNLQSRGFGDSFDILIANPQALKKGKRFIIKDLNRVYPGNLKSNIYEEKLAAQNLQIAKKYRYIIDIHEANCGRDNFVIIPRHKFNNEFPLQYIDLAKVLLWPEPRGPLSQVLKQAIELEFGTKNVDRNDLVIIASSIVEKFISQKITRKKMEFYYVYDKLMTTKLKGGFSQWADFKKVTYSEEEFYPLLIEQYLSLGIICYKMKKIESKIRITGGHGRNRTAE